MNQMGVSLFRIRMVLGRVKGSANKFIYDDHIISVQLQQRVFFSFYCVPIAGTPFDPLLWYSPTLLHLFHVQDGT